MFSCLWRSVLRSVGTDYGSELLIAESKYSTWVGPTAILCRQHDTNRS